MDDDLLSTLKGFEQAEAADEATRAAFDANWRRLAAYREGLAASARKLVGARREEDPGRLLETLVAAEPAVSDAAARRAQEDTRRHQATGTRLARLLPGWRREGARLAKEADAERIAYEEAVQARGFREAVLRRRAEAAAETNRKANRADAVPHRRLLERLRDVDLAISVLQAGDVSAGACLVRWDIEALLKVAELRRRLDLYGRLDETSWDYYCDAGKDRSSPSAQGSSVSQRGEVVVVALAEDGSLFGSLFKAYGGLAEGADLATLDILQMAEMLGRLNLDGLGRDADLLETYLNAVDPGWRETVASRMGTEGEHVADQADGPPDEETPFDILGVTQGMGADEIAAAFRAQMQAVEGLPNSAPQRRLIAAYKAIRAMRRPDREDGGPA